MQVDLMTLPMPLSDMTVLARRTADLGFDGMVVTEAGRTAFLSCAVAAMAAPGLHLSTGVAVAFPRSPMVTATTAWELAEATGGRFRLGLGTQVRAHIERRFSAEFDHPGPRLREYVRALRAIFAAFRGDQRLAFDGEFWNFSLLPRDWSPGPIGVPDPPIDVAAVNPWMLRMAGEVADGVHVHPLNTPAYLRDTVGPELARGAAEVGRDPGSIQRIVPCFTVVGDDPGERARWRELARMQVAFYGSTPNYAFIFDQVDRPGTTEALRSFQKAGDVAGMTSVIDDDLLAHFVVEGTWDDLADRITERFGGLADRVVLYFAGLAARGDDADLERFGRVAARVSTG